MRKIGVIILLLLTVSMIVGIASAIGEAVTFSDIDLHTMSDEQLEEAATAIKEEQRSRIKTKILFDTSEIVLNIGKSATIGTSIVELPEGEKKPKLTWKSSDKSIATCNNGQVRAIKNGIATITCSATLSDGTPLYEECKVQVNIPISSIVADQKTIEIKGGYSSTPTFTIKPEDASIKELSFESSDPEIAVVDETGMIEGVGNGTTTITAKAVDGSGKSAKINVKVVDHRISIETAKKVVLTAIGNDMSIDIFAADGNSYDKRKFHGYSYFYSVASIIDEGTWSTDDDGNTWHVENLIVQNKEYGSYFQYKFDVRFDGKKYYAENGWEVIVLDLKYLDKTNPSRYGENDLSYLDYYSYLIMTPEMIK